MTISDHPRSIGRQYHGQRYKPPQSSTVNATTMAKQYPHNRKTTQNNPQTTPNNKKQRQTMGNNRKQRSNNEKQRHNLTKTGF